MRVPRFDEPSLTEPASSVLARLGLDVPSRPALPPLVDPEGPPVVDPLDEPLVELDGGRVGLLGNYRLAGWEHARDGCRLRASVADRLYQVADGLPDPWGLAVFDGWRPLALQDELYRAAYADPDLPPGFFAEPDNNPAFPPPHLTGGTVDLTLTVNGIPLAPGTGFDDLSPLARTDALEGTEGSDRAVRRLLYWSMRKAGFVVYDGEWWHFEFGTRRWAALTGSAPLFGPVEADR